MAREFQYLTKYNEGVSFLDYKIIKACNARTANNYFKPDKLNSRITVEEFYNTVIMLFTIIL